MNAIVFHGQNDIRLEQRSRPNPGAGEVRLRVLLAGICMTDWHILQGHFAVPAPRVLGHELVGVVDALGLGVGDAWLGREVAVNPATFCGGCSHCRAGRAELCQNFECLGNTADGGFADYTLARAEQLIPLDGMPAEQAVWLEPLACVIHALQVADADDASAVLVMGAGTLGKLMVQTLQATTKAAIAVVDPNLDKVQQAMAMGAEAGWTAPRTGPAPEVRQAFQAWTGTSQPLLLIDTTGQPQAIERILDWAGPGDQVLLFGVSDPAAQIAVSPGLIFTKALTIRAAAGMTATALAAAHTLLRRGQLNTAALVWQTVTLAQAPALLRQMGHGSQGKILIRPDRRGAAAP